MSTLSAIISFQLSKEKCFTNWSKQNKGGKMRPCHVSMLQWWIPQSADIYWQTHPKVHCQACLKFDKLHSNLFRNSLQKGKHITFESLKNIFARWIIKGIFFFKILDIAYWLTESPEFQTSVASRLASLFNWEYPREGLGGSFYPL